jgi:hypothetical protein
MLSKHEIAVLEIALKNYICLWSETDQSNTQNAVYINSNITQFKQLINKIRGKI